MIELIKDILNIREEKILYRKDTPYNNIVVIDDGKKIKLILDSSYNLHSVLVRGSFFTGSYWDVCALLALLMCANLKNSSIVILGFGGGSVSRIIKHLSPNIKVVGVDIDKHVLFVAKQLFNSSADLLVVSEFSSFLETVKRKFSVIFIDVFQKATVPYSLFEENIWELISQKTEYGFVVNTISIIQSEGIIAASKKFFPKVKVLKSPESANYIVFGIKSAETNVMNILEQNFVYIQKTLENKLEKSKILNNELTDILATLNYIFESVKYL